MAVAETATKDSFLCIERGGVEQAFGWVGLPDQALAMGICYQTLKHRAMTASAVAQAGALTYLIDREFNVFGRRGHTVEKGKMAIVAIKPDSQLEFVRHGFSPCVVVLALGRNFALYRRVD